ncbi:MAG: sulfatase [Bacteroidota bacterium]
MRIVLVFLTVLSLALLASCRPKHSSLSQKPNYLFIMVDDLNDWVGCMEGHPQVKTPNIDRLASNGLLFLNAHAQTAICNPSRTSIMTGLYPRSTGIYFNAGNIEDSPVASKAELMTRRFEREGYEVLGAGKLYNNQDQKYMENYADGFGRFGPFPDEKLSSYEGHPLWDWGVYPEEDSITPDYKVANWAIEKLGSEIKEPFFLGVGFFRPHVPMYAPKEWFDLYPVDSIILPEIRNNDLEDISEYAINVTSLEHIEPPHDWILKNSQWKPLVQSYLASVSFVDHQIGTVLEALENSSYAENTIIVLLSDHGFHLGEKRIWAKQTLWEESTRVPLIFSGKNIPKGAVCNRPVQLLDIYPTLLELSELKISDQLAGHSLKPLIADPHSEWPHISMTSFGPGNYAIRSDNYRYIKYLDGSEEFYDHINDQNEWNNLIDTPEMAEQIKWHRKFLPNQAYPILGSGSTGHKAYQSAKELLSR